MKRRSFIKKIRRQYLKDALLVVIAGGLFCTGAALLWVANLKMPSLSAFETRQVSQSTKIYDRTGKILLYDIHSDVRRTVVPFADISRNIKNATVAIEDDQFYQHSGIELKSILRAIFVNLTTFGFNQGGSTITQQVVKNSILTTSKTIARKLEEWILALKLEHAMSKDEILSLYLNESPYGGNIYGVEEASESYFGVKASDVSLAQAAYIAAMPQAPTYYSPYGSHLDALEARKDLVLKRMLDNKFINEDEYRAALAEKVTWLPQNNTGILAPHFVMYIKDYLEQKYGEEKVLSGGLKVTTTLDYGMQQKAETVLKDHAASNKASFNASNAALVAIDPKTGQILAMVGSRDYFGTSTPDGCTSGVNCTFEGNFNAATAHRQPGSSFKPIVYATAFEKGYTPDTVVFDVPTEFSTYCDPTGKPLNPADSDKCYMPVNYDGLFKGPISLRSALAESRNIPSIQVLYLAGIKDSLQTAANMGVTSLGDPNQYGLTLVLGGGEVSLLDMTGAYGVLANSGVRNPTTGILKVEDGDGNTLEQYTPSPSSVLPENVALEVSDILSDELAREPEFGVHSALYIPGRDVAVKTGTTNDYKDAWIIGYTPSLVVGTWAGNNDNSPMEKKIAGFIVAPMWNDFMTQVLGNYPVEYFKKPAPIDPSLKPVLRGLWQGNISYTIDKLSGKLATPYTPPETRQEKVVQQIHSILYWVDKSNPLGPPPQNPAADPQFAYWEYGVQQWAAAHNLTNQDTSVIPTATDDIHVPSAFPVLQITGLAGSYGPNDTIAVGVSNSGPHPLAKADFFINGQFVGTVKTAPFVLSVNLGGLGNLQPTNNKIEVIGYDSIFDQGSATAQFNINN